MEDPASFLESLFAIARPIDVAHFMHRGRRVNVIDDEYSTTAAVSEDFFEGDRRSAHERVEAEYIGEFNSLIDEIRLAWGPPEFLSCQIIKFPYSEDDPQSFEEEMYWRGAIALAYWRKPDGLAYACVEHQDNELPYCLLVGIKR